jgi:hypothetical protein
MKLSPKKRLVTQAWTAWVLAFCGGMLGIQCSFCGELPAATEYQIKALCLLNLAKYVDWPAQAFAETNSPIVIGIIGENKFEDDLKDAMEGKCIGGRKIMVTAVASEKDYRKCQILFIGASDTAGEAEVLKGVKSLPILTVGETEQFARDGGIIDFTTRDEKVRFVIDLNAARAVGLGISSKLLSLAETVRGKP